MNPNPEHFTALMGKYKLSHPISADDQRYILDSTRPSLAALLKRKGAYGATIGAAILIIGIFKKAGISLTLIQAKIVAGLTATALAAACAGGTAAAAHYIKKRIGEPGPSVSVEKKRMPSPVIQTEQKAVPRFASNDQIRKYYHKLEDVFCDDGTHLVGAVIFQDKKTIRVHTIHGVIELPVSSVQTIKIR